MSRAGSASCEHRSIARSVEGGSRGGGYFQRSELPLTSLAFILPLLVLYEVGTRLLATNPAHQPEQRIIAFNLMQQFFALWGATGKYLPALAVVGILLSWHIARGDGWQIDPRHLIGMLVESVIVAVPLIGLGFVAARYLPLAGWDRATANMLVLSIGAGIYEELVFRLIAFTVLSFLLVDLLGINRRWSFMLIVVLSSLAFALYHYLGHEAFQWRSFAFRTAAGVYFGAVFSLRGFGITAGSHAAYDVLVVGLRSFAW